MSTPETPQEYAQALILTFLQSEFHGRASGTQLLKRTAEWSGIVRGEGYSGSVSDFEARSALLALLERGEVELNTDGIYQTPGWRAHVPYPLEIQPTGWAHCDCADMDPGPFCVAHPVSSEDRSVYPGRSVNDGIHWRGRHWHIECALDEALREIAGCPNIHILTPGTSD